MSNGRPKLLREVERMVLLLENGEWTDTMPKHPLAQRLEAALHDLHDELRGDDESPGAPDAAVADAQPLIPGTPKRIWLILDHDDRTPEHFDVLEEVSWCAHPQGPDDIEYVLAQPSSNPGPLAAVQQVVRIACQIPGSSEPETSRLYRDLHAAIAASKEGAKT